MQTSEKESIFRRQMRKQKQKINSKNNELNGSCKFVFWQKQQN